MEPHGSQNASDRGDIMVGEATRPRLGQRGLQSLKIGIQLGGLTVSAGLIADLGQLTRVDFHR
jgi:hypothetical protein